MDEWSFQTFTHWHHPKGQYQCEIQFKEAAIVINSNQRDDIGTTVVI